MFEAARRALPIRETHQLLLATTEVANGDDDVQLRIGTGRLDIAAAVAAAAREEDSDPPKTQTWGSEMDNHTVETATAEQHELIEDDIMEQTAIPNLEHAEISETESLDRETELDASEEIDEACVGEESIADHDGLIEIDEDWELQQDSWTPSSESAPAVSLSEAHVDQASRLLASGISALSGEAGTDVLPAALFDSVTYGISSVPREQLKPQFQIVALPGEHLHEAPRPGDLIVERAIAEGDLAWAEVILDSCSDASEHLYVRVMPLTAAHADTTTRQLTDSSGRLDHRKLIIRPLLDSTESSQTRESDLAENPAAAAAAATFLSVAGTLISGTQLGLAVFDRLERHLLSGSFSVTSHAASYVHNTSPAGLRVHTKRFFFAISAHHPRYGFGNQNFYFQLTLEYDGFNIRRVSIVEDRGRSSSLVSSSFSITFSPARYSSQSAPIAAIVYNLHGEWDPIGRGHESFDGSLLINAQGRLLRLRINSPRRWVWRQRRITSRGGGTVPGPTRAQHITSVQFDRPGRTRLSQSSIRHIHGWYTRLPTAVKAEIRRGRVPIELTGRASTTGTVQRNQQIARARAASVAAVFRDLAGNSADINTRAHGELGASGPDNREDPNERRVEVVVSYRVYKLKRD